MKIGFYDPVAFPGTGVHEAERFAGRGGYDTHVAYHAVGAVGAGKEDEIAQLSLPQRDRVLNGCEIYRRAGYHNAKVIKHISHKTRTIKTFLRIGSAIFVGCPSEGACEVDEGIGWCFPRFDVGDILCLVGCQRFLMTTGNTKQQADQDIFITDIHGVQ